MQTVPSRFICKFAFTMGTAKMATDKLETLNRKKKHVELTHTLTLRASVTCQSKKTILPNFTGQPGILKEHVPVLIGLYKGVGLLVALMCC